jgi:hypothetical protein
MKYEELLNKIREDVTRIVNDKRTYKILIDGLDKYDGYKIEVINKSGNKLYEFIYNLEETEEVKEFAKEFIENKISFEELKEKVEDLSYTFQFDFNQIVGEVVESTGIFYLELFDYVRIE